MRPELLRARGAVLRALRLWFDKNGYTEVQTPTLVPCAAMEEHLEPVAVGELFLHTSPEFAMKRILAAGLCRIYQITHCFREEEAGVHHSREFSMLEWYRVGAGTPELMDDTTELIQAAARAVGAPVPHFDRRSVAELMLEHGVSDKADPDTWLRTWVEQVEPTLSRPTIVHDYPKWQAALARERNGCADRFEVYLGGVELANAFAEETDPRTIRQRFIDTNAARCRAGRPPHPVDDALIEASGRMPRTAGIALGIDRLVMVLTDTEDIAAVQVRNS